MISPTLQTIGDDCGSELLCPYCYGNYLSHGDIHIFHRKEDAREGVHVAVRGLSITVDDNLDGNASVRRGALAIDFDCEGCGRRSKLILSQHKGNSIIGFSSDPSA